MLFRVKLPNALRPFKCPAVFIIAPIALIACIYLLGIQILDGDFTLMIAGQLLIYWFIVMFILYILRSFFIKNQVL